MKQVLAVMATFMCLCLGMGFTVTDNSTNDAKTGTNLRKQISRWKNSTWVNPWVNTKRSNTPKIILANNLAVVNWTDLDILRECNVMFTGGNFDLRTPGYFINELPVGQTVTFTGEVDGSNGNIIVVQLTEAYTNQTIYFYNAGPSTVYQWTPQLGQYYVLTIEDF